MSANAAMILCGVVGPDAPPLESRQVNCISCGVAVWLSNLNEVELRSQGIPFRCYCIPCGFIRAQGETIEITEAQVELLRSQGLSDADIANFRAKIAKVLGSKTAS